LRRAPTSPQLVEAVKAVRFEHGGSDRIRRLLLDFRAMLNFCIQEALRLKTASLAKLHRALYERLKARWRGYRSLYYVTACRVALQILRSWRKGRRSPVVEKLFVRLHKQLFKLEGHRLSVILGSSDRISLRLRGGGYQHSFLEAYERGELKIGEVLLSEKHATIPFIKEVKLTEPRGAVAVDLNESCVACVDDEGRLTWIDAKLVRTVHTEYFKKRRRIQQKVKSETVKATLLAKYGQRERRRVEGALHKIAKQVVELATGKAILLEDLRGLKKRTKLGRMLNRRLCSWNYRRLQDFIEYKARWAGLPVLYLPAKGTSKSCSRCGGEISPKERACPTCGLDRHVNACLNLLGMWGGASAPKALVSREEVR